MYLIEKILIEAAQKEALVTDKGLAMLSELAREINSELLEEDFFDSITWQHCKCHLDVIDNTITFEIPHLNYKKIKYLI